jgi:hypothetical protein
MTEFAASAALSSKTSSTGQADAKKQWRVWICLDFGRAIKKGKVTEVV